MFNQELQSKGLSIARGIAEFLCNLRHVYTDYEPAAGSFLFSIENSGNPFPASSWNYSFASMGLFSAAKAFNEPYYEKVALQLMGYLKTLQIFDPFHEEHYGAIREHSPQTPWCYTRDALSAAWGFLETYRYTGHAEYLKRAELWAEWFFQKGLDPEGYPWFGVQFDNDFPFREKHIKNDIQGNFQGGSLCFLFQLARETDNAMWIGKEFINIADIFCDYIQQPTGFFASVYRDNKKVSENDEYQILHRANDDLGTLGLICAYKVTKNKKYLESIKKFLAAVFAEQAEDGNFEDSIAPVPVVLNVLFELDGLIDVRKYKVASQKALEALYKRQCNGKVNPKLRGGLIELGSRDGYATARANCYALIYLLKIFANRTEYLNSK